MAGSHELSACQAVGMICDGRLSSVELVRSCLARIEETGPGIQAWAHLEPEVALAQAEVMDRIRRAGRATGVLHGIPIGLKDIIDTKDLPTECGTSVFAGRRPERDAALVDRLREAGAVVMGKTVTTELAFVSANQTRNPHDPARSPGGSSSGSAAAVAANQVPLAVGTQTNGSVIRPASYCGVFGLKPTAGMISRKGVLQTSETLDQIGGFARTLEDAALLVDALAGYDPEDPASFARPRPSLSDGAAAEAPVEPALIWLDFPHHDRLSADAAAGFEAVLEALGGAVERLSPAETLAGLIEVQQTIHEVELARHLDEVIRTDWERTTPALQTVVERARGISEAQYCDALGVRASAQAFFKDFFNDYDAVLAPAATGPAPPFDEGTGDPICSTVWTLAGLPCVTLPVVVAEGDLPLGLQLVGAQEEDDRLMRTAKWVLGRLSGAN